MNYWKDLGTLHKILFSAENDRLEADIFDESNEDDDFAEYYSHNFSETDANDIEDGKWLEDYYRRKDNMTKWTKSVGRKKNKNWKENIITKLPGKTGSRKGWRTVYVSWNCFYTNEMLNV